MIQAIKKAYPILDEKGRPCTFPTFASQVYMEDGTSVESAIQNMNLNNDSNSNDVVVDNCKMPVGGSTGQILAKSSDEDFDMQWIDAPVNDGTGDTSNETIQSISVDDIYPVGSIYMSVDSTSPASRFANTTWEQLKDRFLIGAGSSYSNGATGGAEKVTIAEKNLPWNTVILSQYGSRLGMYGRDDQNGSDVWGFSALSDAYKNASSGLYVDGTNYNVAMDNMPPYLSVYMWKRVS